MKFLKKILSAWISPKRTQLASQETAVEDWATFKRFKGGIYWLMIVNRGLLQDNRDISMSWFTIEYKFLQRHLVNAHMPHPDLIEFFDAFEEEIEKEIAGIDGEMAAAQTGFGTRVVWFCAPSLRLENILRTKTQQFGTFAVDVSPSSYQQFKSLLPTHLEQQLQGNSLILKQLFEIGDNGNTEREVMHWIREFDAAKQSSLCDALQSMGYNIEETTEEQICFSQITSLSIESTSEETVKLNAFCDQFGCVYDGWDTPVAKPSVR